MGTKHTRSACRAGCHRSTHSPQATSESAALHDLESAHTKSYPRAKRASIQVRDQREDRTGFDNALIASLLLAAFEAVIYITLSAFVLIGRWCSADTDVGLWYGVVVALTFALTWGFLPAGLIAQGYIDEVSLSQLVPVNEPTCPP